MEADQSCLERGCGSLRGPVRSPQEPMSTRRWGPSRSGDRPRTGPMQRIGKQKASYSSVPSEAQAPHPPFLESPKTVCPKKFLLLSDVSHKKGVGLALGGAFQII